jgi:hypothetical protein
MPWFDPDLIDGDDAQCERERSAACTLSLTLCVWATCMYGVGTCTAWGAPLSAHHVRILDRQLPVQIKLGRQSMVCRLVYHPGFRVYRVQPTPVQSWNDEYLLFRADVWVHIRAQVLEDAVGFQRRRRAGGVVVGQPAWQQCARVYVNRDRVEVAWQTIWAV